MRRYKLRKRTYYVLIGMTTLSSLLLVVALAQSPAPDGERYVTTGPGSSLPGAPEVVGDHRTPIIAVSVVGMAAPLAAMAFSGGVKYIDRGNVLESAVRKQMFEYIRKNPGVYLREISRELDINPTNTSWHLRKLTEADLVRCQMANGLKLYYPIEGGVRTKQTAVANSILKNGNAQTIVAYLLAHPGGHQREIARALGVNHGTVRWHLKKLVLCNVVNEHADGSAYKYYISQEGMEFLAQHGGMEAMLGTVEPAPTPETTGAGAREGALPPSGPEA